MTKEILRLYTFTLKKLKPIDIGVQSAHACIELGYNFHNNEMFEEWIRNYGILAFLDGGNYGNLKRLYELARTVLIGSKIPFAGFCEDEETLGGLLTSFAFLFPQSLRTLYEFSPTDAYNEAFRLYDVGCKKEHFYDFMEVLKKAKSIT